MPLQLFFMPHFPQTVFSCRLVSRRVGAIQLLKCLGCLLIDWRGNQKRPSYEGCPDSHAKPIRYKLSIITSCQGWTE
jgi:hypothetical protein